MAAIRLRRILGSVVALAFGHCGSIWLLPKLGGWVRQAKKKKVKKKNSDESCGRSCGETQASGRKGMRTSRDRLPLNPPSEVRRRLSAYFKRFKRFIFDSSFVNIIHFTRRQRRHKRSRKDRAKKDHEQKEVYTSALFSSSTT